MSENTISQVVKDELCTGCGTCIALCPKEAIKLTIDEKSIYIPELDENKCNNFGICYKICPGYEINFKKLNYLIIHVVLNIHKSFLHKGLHIFLLN